MSEPTINQISTYRYSVQYPGHEPLYLDFEPLARAAIALEPCKTYVLKHWQAKPKGERRFGCFTMHKDGSTSYQCHKVAPVVRTPHFDVQVDEGNFLPTAALFYPAALVAEGAPYPYAAR